MRRISRVLIILISGLLLSFLVGQMVLAEEDNRSVIDVMDNIEKDESTEIDGEGPSEQNSEDVVPSLQDQNIFMLLLRIIFYLILIIALIVALSKFLSSRQRKMGQHRIIQNLGGSSLGSNKSLQLVKVGGKIYLIGVGDQVNLIKELTNPEEIEQINQDLADQESVLSKNIFSFIKSKLNPQEDSDDSNPFKTVFQKSIEKQQHQRDQIKTDLNGSEEERRFR